MKMTSCYDCIKAKFTMPIIHGRIYYSETNEPMQERGLKNTLRCKAKLWEDEPWGDEKIYYPVSFSAAKNLFFTEVFMEYFDHCAERLLNGEEHLNNVD